MSNAMKTAEPEAADRSGGHGRGLESLLRTIAATLKGCAPGLPLCGRTERSFLCSAGQTALVATIVS